MKKITIIATIGLSALIFLGVGGTYVSQALRDMLSIDGTFAKLIFKEGAAPGTPPSTQGYIYWKADGKVYSKNDAGTESDLTAGSGSGDNVSVDGVATVDPNFASTGDIDFVYAGGTVTANINNDSITEGHLTVTNAPTDNYVLTYNAAGSNFTWVEDSTGTGTSQWNDTGSIVHPSEETVDEIAIGGTTEAGADIFLGVDGTAVFNEQSNDVDFRIEGNTDANLVYVDAGNDRIGFGTNTPTVKVDVNGVVKATQFQTASTAGNTGAVALSEDPTNDTQTYTLKAASSMAANVTMTLPSADSAGLFKSNGSGTFSIRAESDTKGIWFEDPVAADDFKSIWMAKKACTITSIWAESDQTVTFMLQIDDGTPADIDTVDLAPAAGTAEDTALNGDVTMAAGDRLDLDLVSVSGTPTWVSIQWTFTYDD